MSVPLGRLVLYTHRLDALAEFYATHFGFERIDLDGDRIVEMRPPAGGVALLLHPAAKGHREGQSSVKLVFDVADVEAMRARLLARDVDVGPVHQADGYTFANLKDPTGNSVSLSSRAFRPPNAGGTGEI